MTKDHAIVSFQLPLAEIALLDAEAKQAPFLCTRAKYVAQIVLGRHDMAVEASPEINELLEQHQRDLYLKDIKIGIIQESNDELRARLTQRQIQIDEELKQAYVEKNEAYEQVNLELGMLEFKYEYLQKSAQQTEQELAQTKKKLQEAEAINRQLTDQVKTSKEVELASAFISKNLGNLLGQAPGLQKRIETEGLSSLWFGKRKAASSAETNEDQQLGQRIRHDFPDEKLNVILTVIQFLRDTPAALKAFLAGPDYQAYQPK